MKRPVSTFLLFAALAAVAFAQEMSVPDTRVPEQIKFAQPFTLQMYVQHPENAYVSTDESAFPRDFEITDVSVEKKSPTGTLFSISAIPFTINQSTFTATFVAQKSGAEPVQVTKEVPLKVEKVSVFKDNEFRDIRAPKAPFNWLLWLLLILAAALIVGAVVYANRARLAAKKLAGAREITDNRPANVIALSKIDALVSSGLWENRQYKVFYLSLSDIFREYLWRMFGIDVSADTSTELLRRLKTLPQFAPLLTALRSVLASGDLVKFARVIPTIQVRNRDITVLREIIKQTAPKPEPQPQEKTL